MKTLVCFISHVVNDELINRYLAIKKAVIDKYDIKYISPNKHIEDSRIQDDIVNLNIKEDMIDHINSNCVKGHLYYTYMFERFDDYDRYWIIENDVIINNDDLTEGWKNLFDFYDKNDADLICSKIHKYTDVKGYQKRYPEQLLNQYNHNILYNIDIDKLYFGFFPVGRFSNKLLNIIYEYYQNYDGYLEYIFPSLAYANQLKISSLTIDGFDIEHTKLLNFPHRINIGSNTWLASYVKNYRTKFPKNVIIHPIKAY